jgi:hypothetical protein
MTVAQDCEAEQFEAAVREILSTQRSARTVSDADNAEEEVHRVSRVEAVCCATPKFEGREHGI